MTMDAIEQVRLRIEAAIPGASLQIIPNESPALQPSIAISGPRTLEVARFLRDDAHFRLNFCSNVTGVDWLDAEITEKIKVKKMVEGVEKEVEEVKKTTRPGYLEAVYHFYSMELKHGPLVIRQRTGNRTDDVEVQSLTPVWRGCEFQEREIFDLYGIHFKGHPDLRRILMWDEFKDHPMRRDYTEPDDYEYEPTPHDDVLEKAKKRLSTPAAS